jgi:hypothetical protein
VNEKLSAAGKRGGELVKAKYGSEHFARIGAIGGKRKKRRKGTPARPRKRLRKTGNSLVDELTATIAELTEGEKN